MARADYYHCDVCGCKAFYDAELRKNQATLGLELTASNNQLREALHEITYSHDGYAIKKAEQALATYDKLSEVKHDTK